MLRVLIVDDERLARQAMRRLLAAHPDVEIVGEAEGVTQALQEIERTRPQMIFLDIELGGGDGFDLLAALDRPPIVVFVTAYAEHAVEAFAVNAVDYLLKPVAPERLAESLTRVERQLARGEEPASAGRGVIALRTPKRTLLAQTEEIVAVRADGDFTHVFVADQPALMIWRTLGHFETPAAVAAVPAARPLADRQSRPPAPGRDAVARDGAHPAAGHGRGADLGPRRLRACAMRWVATPNDFLPFARTPRTTRVSAS